MAYGILKVDTITFTDGGVDKSVPVSGLVQNPTFTGNITATGTISGNIIQGGTTVSGVTVTGTTANFASGVFTTQISGVTVIATTGTFTSLTGATTTMTSGVFALGTALLPSISFVSDPNTGIYSPGADQLAVATNGAGALFVDAFGRVGVGAISSGARFEVRGGSGPYMYIVDSGANGGAFVAEATNSIVNIGATYLGAAAVPLALVVGGNEKARIRVDGTFEIKGAGTAGTSPGFSVNPSTPADSFVIDSSGRLGIGTSSPEGPLHVMAASSSDGAIIQRWGYTVVDQGTYDLTLKTGVSSGIVKYNFSMRNNGTSYNDVLVLDRGKVGIGDNAPDSTLTIKAATSVVPLRVSGPSSEFARIDTSGRLLIGTTSADGLISNISPVVAGAFKSHSGSVSIAPSTTVTIFTIPASNGEGAYTVTAIYVNSNNVTTFSAYAVILYDGSGTNAYRALGYDGGFLSITVSGRDVQLTTGATYTQGIKWSFVKQAVA